VCSFLTAHQHKKSYLVPFKVYMMQCASCEKRARGSTNEAPRSLGVIERQRCDDRGAKGAERGEMWGGGVPLGERSGDGAAPPPQKIF